MQQAGTAKGVTRFLDSTHIKVHRAGSNPAGGQAAQAMGRTKGGLNSKLHALVDLDAKPIGLKLTAGQVSDVSQADEMLGALDAGVLVADKAYDSDELRSSLYDRGVKPCIPARSNRVDPLPHGIQTYKKRHRIENFFERLKRFRRVATRYDKLAVTFLGFVQLAATISLRK